MSEKEPARAELQPVAQPSPPSISDIKSPGAARIKALYSSLTVVERIAIFSSIFLVGFAYGLDGMVRSTYQPYATASFGKHSLLSTINVILAVVAAASQPTAAKIADIFGRVELVGFSVFLYVIGTVVEAVARNISTYAGGSVIYEVGVSMIKALNTIIVSDITSTRSRLFFSYTPISPALITTWVSGNVASSVLAVTSWRWGIGMWGVIFPFCSLSLIISLLVVGRRAKKQSNFEDRSTPLRALGLRGFSLSIFWLLDVVGIILLVAILALFLAPLTLAGGSKDQWKSPDIIAPLVVSFVCVPAFVYWELRAPRPLIPMTLMKNRAVWGPLGVAVSRNFGYHLQANYLYTMLVVAFDFSITAATRISSLFMFVQVVVGPILGLVVFKVRRLKMFILSGTVIYMVAFGLLIKYRGSASSKDRVGVIAGQVLLGVGGALFSWPSQASMQAGLKHEHLAVMTGIFFASYNVGSALGNTVSGAFWTQLLPPSLHHELAGINSTLASTAYSDPFGAVAEWPMGTPERAAIVRSYQYIQRLITITGICLCVPVMAFALATRDPKLNDEQTLAGDDSLDRDEQPGWRCTTGET
ncbi:transporter [Aspergillus sp. HF37]|nr:transporter [Aspergillus sp. HF37]